MKKIFQVILFVSLVTFLVGCSSAQGDTVPENPLTKLSHDALGSYSSIFEIQFSGPVNWVYQLRTRKSPTLREENLYLQGISKTQNPGDIRMVTDGTDTWMIGPGTDNECVRFPNNQGMDPTLIYPETLVPLADLADELSLVGEEKINGKTANHYSGSGLTIGIWQDARIDVWQDKASLALLRYVIQASGEDALFATGSGLLKARYEVDSFDKPDIEPVAGCEIDAPLPENISMLVRFPGMASFEVPSGRDAVVAYYQSALVKQGWAEREPVSVSEGSAVLSYSRGAESLEIHVEGNGEDASKVRLLFLQ